MANCDKPEVVDGTCVSQDSLKAAEETPQWPHKSASSRFPSSIPVFTARTLWWDELRKFELRKKRSSPLEKREEDDSSSYLPQQEEGSFTHTHTGDARKALTEKQSAAANITSFSQSIRGGRDVRAPEEECFSEDSTTSSSTLPAVDLQSLMCVKPRRSSGLPPSPILPNKASRGGRNSRDDFHLKKRPESHYKQRQGASGGEAVCVEAGVAVEIPGIQDGCWRARAMKPLVSADKQPSSYNEWFSPPYAVASSSGSLGVSLEGCSMKPSVLTLNPISASIETPIKPSLLTLNPPFPPAQPLPMKSSSTAHTPPAQLPPLEGVCVDSKKRAFPPRCMQRRGSKGSGDIAAISSRREPSHLKGSERFRPPPAHLPSRIRAKHPPASKGRKAESSAVIDDPDYLADKEKKLIFDKVKLLDSMEEVEVLVQIVRGLEEPNVGLFDRILHRLGVEQSLSIFEETMAVEASGGMLTTNNERRTKGGVYIALLKQKVSPSDVQFIWDEQNRFQKERKRKKRKLTATNSLNST